MSKYNCDGESWIYMLESRNNVLCVCWYLQCGMFCILTRHVSTTLLYWIVYCVCYVYKMLSKMSRFISFFRSLSLLARLIYAGVLGELKKVSLCVRSVYSHHLILPIYVFCPLFYGFGLQLKMIWNHPVFGKPEKKCVLVRLFTWPNNEIAENLNQWRFPNDKDTDDFACVQ